MGPYKVAVRVVVRVVVGVLEGGMVLEGVGEFSGDGVLLGRLVDSGEGVSVASSSCCAGKVDVPVGGRVEGLSASARSVA